MADPTRPPPGRRLSSPDALGVAGVPRQLSAAQWRVLRLFAVVVALATVGYLTWRVAATMGGAALWIAIPFWLLELHGAIRFMMTVAELWDSDAVVEPPGSGRPAGRVALVIPTYDEESEVLLPTVAAALEVRGADEVWVLDDGHRPQVQAMASQLGCGYISRSSNEHAKAGNINYALGLLSVDFLAVVDADHVPQPEFLERTLPYFHDADVALVQTPQEFYNRDSFVHTDDGYHEELFFHRVIQAGKNRYGAAFWCGTGSVIRTSALRSVGGASTVSITEDLHTAMLLQRAGWKTVHHNEPLAAGLAARNYAEFSKQRWRWGAGAMQSFAVDFPLTTPGLSAGQRFAYFASFTSWFDSWRNFGYFLTPILVLLTGASPIRAPLWPLLPVALAVTVAQLAVIRMMGRGALRLWFASVAEFLRMPVNLSSTLVFLRPRSLGFSVTPKGRTDGQRASYQSPLLLRLMLAAAVTATAFGVVSLTGAFGLGYERPSVALIALGWLAANTAVLATAVARIVSPRFGSEQRGAARLDVPAVCRVAGRESRLVNLSMSGARVRVAGDWSSTEGAMADVELGFSTAISLRASVTRVYETGAISEIGVEFLAEQWAPLSALALELHRTGPTLRRVVTSPARALVKAA